MVIGTRRWMSSGDSCIHFLTFTAVFSLQLEQPNTHSDKIKLTTTRQENFCVLVPCGNYSSSYRKHNILRKKVIILYSDNNNYLKLFILSAISRWYFLTKKSFVFRAKWRKEEKEFFETVAGWRSQECRDVPPNAHTEQYCRIYYELYVVLHILLLTCLGTAVLLDLF